LKHSQKENHKGFKKGFKKEEEEAQRLWKRRKIDQD
jgi:hypothetical protein